MPKGVIPVGTGGFTPIIDVVAERLGLVTAAVFGIVWRHCQMSDGVCWASLRTMEQMLGLGRSALKNNLAKLVEAGYIEDTTPDARGRSHVYRDTGKVRLIGSIRAVVSDDDCPADGQHDSDTVHQVDKLSTCRTNCPPSDHNDTKETKDTIVRDASSRNDNPGGSERNAKRKEAESNFVRITQISSPANPRSSTAAVRWWTPLRRMLEDCEWNTSRTTMVMERAVAKMRADKLTISAPASIEQVFMATSAELRLERIESGPVRNEDGSFYVGRQR